MSSGVPSINVLTGSYQPNELENPIKFTAIYSDSDNLQSVAFTFTETTQSIRKLSNVGIGGMFHVTKDSFNDFISNVLNKGVGWNAEIVNMPHNTKVLIPGTWRSDDGNKKNVITGDEMPEVFGGATKGYYGGSRKHTHRKPTKRRRSRRVYRKTKKN